MGFVKIDLKNAKEPEVVPEGRYSLRVVKVMDSETKKKDPMTVVTIRIETNEVANPAPIQHFITYPNGGQWDDMRALEIKRLLTVFGVRYDEAGFDTEELLGATGESLVIQEEGDDGVVRNRLKLPRIKE